MPITDLTGTKWLFNEDLVATWPFGDQGDYIAPNITFTSNGETYNQLTFTFNIVAEEISLEYGSDFNFVYRYDFDTEENTWTNEAYKTIEITGGTDATASYVIEWLQANATQIIEPQPTDTNKISIGSLKLAKAFIGNSEVVSMWLGNVKIYEKVGTPTPTGYNLTISGAFSNVGPESYGSKITINNTTCSVDYLGNTTNIPHTFTNVTTFVIESYDDTPIGCCKVISGSGYYSIDLVGSPQSYQANDIIVNALVGQTTITMTSDTVIELGYYEAEEEPLDPDAPL